MIRLLDRVLTVLDRDLPTSRHVPGRRGTGFQPVLDGLKSRPTARGAACRTPPRAGFLLRSLGPSLARAYDARTRVIRSQEAAFMAECANCFKTYDGLQLYERAWLPPTEPRGVVAVVHGFTEHGGRYGPLAGELNRHGYAMYALDLRGHGRSEGERVFVRSFDEYLADVELYVDRVRCQQPGKPIFLLGYSMGGTILIRLATLSRLDVRGVILVAPGIMLGRKVFPLLRRLAPWIGRWLPRLRLVRFGASMLSRDPKVVEAFRNDPYVFHGRFALRTAAEILQTLGQIGAEMQQVTRPLLILHGTGDAVTEPQGSRDLYARAASADKTLKLYDGLYHDLLNEPEKDQVRGDVVAWISERT